MKIDPRVQLPSDNQPDPVKSSRSSSAQSKGATGASGANPAAGEDTVSISSTHGELQSLTASLANVPEVRTDRVNALQQQVNSGQYQPDSQKIADAILVDQASRSARA
jgi:negative regulator of flagellin synthesis FlgM